MSSYADSWSDSTAAGNLSVAADVFGLTLQKFGESLQHEEVARGLHFNIAETERQSRLTINKLREDGKRVNSAQRTGFAKAGVVLTGTPLEVMLETAGIVEENVLEVRMATVRRIEELRRAAAARERAARKSRRAGVGAVIGGVVGGFIGGPAGASAGARFGSAIGGS